MHLTQKINSTANLYSTAQPPQQCRTSYPILRYYGEYHGQGSDNGVPDGLVFQYHRAGTLVDNLALENDKGSYSLDTRNGLVSLRNCPSIIIN